MKCPKSKCEKSYYDWIGCLGGCESCSDYKKNNNQWYTNSNYQKTYSYCSTGYAMKLGIKVDPDDDTFVLL